MKALALVIGTVYAGIGISFLVQAAYFFKEYWTN